MSGGYLVDTSTLSAASPGKIALHPHLADWLRTHQDRLYISTVTIAEIEQGLKRLVRAGAAARAEKIEEWLQAILSQAPDRILPLDASVARITGALSDAATAIGRHPGFPDVAIAATAKAHDLIIATANAKHFEPLGVPFFNPAA